MKPTPEDTRDGLKRKYTVAHADGTPCDADAQYFVLRLDYHRDCDNAHITACRAAAWTYAQAIEKHLPALGADLRKTLTEGLTAHGTPYAETAAPKDPDFHSSPMFDFYKKVFSAVILIGESIKAVMPDSPDSREVKNLIALRLLDLACALSKLEGIEKKFQTNG